MEVIAIGTVHSSRTEPTDDDWDHETTVIHLSDEFDESALWGLDTFSHIEVVYAFHRVEADNVEVGARRPRGNPDWPEVGIFAQRGKNRPNRLGVTTCACWASTAAPSLCAGSTPSTARR